MTTPIPGYLPDVATATMEDWIDYLNLHYEWNPDIGMNADKITPALIERVLRTDGYITRKE